jgi:hypothetical protein
MTGDISDFLLGIDPVVTGGASGAVFVPMIGIQHHEDTVEIGGNRIVRLTPGSWNLIENNRYVDFYRHYYAAAPRSYLVYPFSAQALETADDPYAFLLKQRDEAYERARNLVLALRLAFNGLLIAPERVVVVARANSVNSRWPDDRFRFYTAVVGDPIILGSRTVQFGDRTEFLPSQQITSLGGPPVRISTREVPRVEKFLALIDRYKNHAKDDGIEYIIRNFGRSWDVLLDVRTRRVALIAAFEGAFGKFSSPRGRDSVGARVFALWRAFPDTATEIAARIEGPFREMRRAYSHGAENKRVLDQGTAVEVSLASVRMALTALIAIACADDEQKSVLAPLRHPDDAKPVASLRALLRATAHGNEEAVAALCALIQPLTAN